MNQPSRASWGEENTALLWKPTAKLSPDYGRATCLNDATHCKRHVVCFVVFLFHFLLFTLKSIANVGFHCNGVEWNFFFPIMWWFISVVSSWPVQAQRGSVGSNFFPWNIPAILMVLHSCNTNNVIIVSHEVVLEKNIQVKYIHNLNTWG